MAGKILLLNGPNLNMLGKRDPQVYGDITLNNVEEICKKLAKQNGLELESKQTNYEGQIVELIHTARETSDAIIINPGAYSHTSIAIFDALKDLVPYQKQFALHWDDYCFEYYLLEKESFLQPFHLCFLEVRYKNRFH